MYIPHWTTYCGAAYGSFVAKYVCTFEIYHIQNYKLCVPSVQKCFFWSLGAVHGAGIGSLSIGRAGFISEMYI